MTRVYEAMIRNGQVEWLDRRPSIAAGQALHALIIPFEDDAARTDRGERMRAALEKLAETGEHRQPSDAGAWQREIREDRTLPGRP